MTRRRAVLLDRDGTINRDRRTYVKSPEELEFLPGALEAMRRLATLGFPVVVVTNQSAIGRGQVAPEAVANINALMVREIERHGGRVRKIYVCPHVPDDGCECRKPRPGLLRLAAQELDLDLARSYVIGDRPSDIQAGQAVGSTTIWLTAGDAWVREHGPAPDHVATTLRHAVEWIASREVRRRQPPGLNGARSRPLADHRTSVR